MWSVASQAVVVDQELRDRKQVPASSRLVLLTATVGNVGWRS